jgi:hypothetical protein
MQSSDRCAAQQEGFESYSGVGRSWMLTRGLYKKHIFCCIFGQEEPLFPDLHLYLSTGTSHLYESDAASRLQDFIEKIRQEGVCPYLFNLSSPFSNNICEAFQETSKHSSIANS